jgi:hypothetical protein
MNDSDETMIISFLIEYAKLFDKKIVYNDAKDLEDSFKDLESLISRLLKDLLNKYNGIYNCVDWCMECQFQSYNELIDAKKFLTDNFFYSDSDFSFENKEEGLPYALKFRIFKGVEVPPKIKPQKKKKNESINSIYNRMGGMRESDASEKSYDSLFSDEE